MKKRCSICDEQVSGYGANSQPLRSGRFCEMCDEFLVMPYRIILGGKSIKGSVVDVVTKLKESPELKYCWKTGEIKERTNKEFFDGQLKANMETVLKSRERSSTETLKVKLDSTQRKLIALSRKGHKTDASQQEADDLMEEIRAIQADLAMSQANDITVELMLGRLRLVKDIAITPLAEFKEEVFRNLIDKAVVMADNKRPTAIKFVFCSGLEITQEL